MRLVIKTRGVFAGRVGVVVDILMLTELLSFVLKKC